VAEAYILDAVRTPRARRQGKFTAIHPVDLLVMPLKALLARNALEPSLVEDLIIGCVTQTGEQGGCIARKAVLAAGWPDSIPGLTVNRLCGSGQQAVNMAAESVMAGQHELLIGGGVEHMTRCPMFSDIKGEESVLIKRFHPHLAHQATAAERLAWRFGFSREELDRYSYESQMRAKRAMLEERFKKSIIPVSYRMQDGEQALLDRDDNPRPDTTMAALAALQPAFKDGEKVTAGNSSAIVDGAAAVLIGSADKARRLGLKPRARVVAMKVVGSDPSLMLTGPLEACRLVLKQANLSSSQIDLWEINEAFAPVPLLVIRELGLDPLKVNVNGGAIPFGHPLGATGAMLINTALDELERTLTRYALITMCTGLGMGIATIIERV